MKRIVISFYLVMFFVLTCGFSWKTLFWFPHPRSSVITTPPISDLPVMGWNTYFSFGYNPISTPSTYPGCAGVTYNGATLEAFGDAMVSEGYQSKGYNYLNMDEGWGEPGRTVGGDLKPRFALLPVANYLHARGLRFGYYLDRGNDTCWSCEAGSYGYEEQDANFTAANGIDYVSEDTCNGVGVAQDDYTLMYTKLLATGRDIIFSICDTNTGFEAWMPAVSNQFALSSAGDPGQTWIGRLVLLRKASDLQANFGPGNWPILDVMPFGNGNLTANEEQTFFSMSAVLNASLQLSFDIRTAPATLKAMVQNSEVIAINQDPAMNLTTMIQGDWELAVPYIHKKILDNGNVAFSFFNATAGSLPVSVTWTELGLAGYYSIRDCWGAVNGYEPEQGTFITEFTGTVPSHAASIYVAHWVAGTPTSTPTITLTPTHSPTFTPTCNPSCTPPCCNRTPGTGGAITIVDGVTEHTFTESGSLTISCDNTAVTVAGVAQGGPGGNSMGGGGGAGGAKQWAVTLAAGIYSIQIGSGSNDGNTIFNGVTLIKGGTGGTLPGVPGSTGGSGGGGGISDGVTQGGAGTAGQGYAGGTGYREALHWSAAGGGGASIVGTNGVQDVGGNGGDGLIFDTPSGPVTMGAGGGGFSWTGTVGQGGLGNSGGDGGTSSTNGGNATGDGNGGGGGGESRTGGTGSPGKLIIWYGTP